MTALLLLTGCTRDAGAGGGGVYGERVFLMAFRVCVDGVFYEREMNSDLTDELMHRRCSAPSSGPRRLGKKFRVSERLISDLNSQIFLTRKKANSDLYDNRHKLGFKKRRNPILSPCPSLAS